MKLDGGASVEPERVASWHRALSSIVATSEWTSSHRCGSFAPLRRHLSDPTRVTPPCEARFFVDAEGTWRAVHAVRV